MGAKFLIRYFDNNYTFGYVDTYAHSWWEGLKIMWKNRRGLIFVTWWKD